MTTTRIGYKLYLAADLSIGSGVGLPGVIDEYVVRDQKDFAYAPFSGVKGMARDSCVQLMKYLGCYEMDDYGCAGHRELIATMQLGQASPRDLCGLRSTQRLCVLCTIFGSPVTPARWWFSPARYTENYCEVVGKYGTSDGLSKGARRDSATSAHAAIDPLTKRAAEKQLFNLEVVRLPDTDATVQELAVWEGEVIYSGTSLDQRGTARDDDELLGWLLASLLFTRRIGGRRRRGWGRCRFVLSGGNKATLEAKLDEWLNTLKTNRILRAGG